SSKLISGLVGSGVGALVVNAWGYGGAFALAGSIGLGSAVLACFLKAPGRPKQGGRPHGDGRGRGGGALSRR
ncbi:hypothetical protein ACFFTL_28840, partial [Streptomyces yanii]